jgi:ornithine carbamoyltransferase
MDDACADADIVYPKSWAPYAVMEERTNRLRARRTDHLRELEAEALAQNAKYQDWTCSTARMRLTKNARALYMHCLPADITGVSCTHGEVDREVFEAARMETYKQASYKPFAIAALMLGMRVHQPAAALGRLFEAGQALARKTRASTPPPPSSRRY